MAGALSDYVLAAQPSIAAVTGSINQRQVTVSADSKSKYEGAAEPALTYRTEIQSGNRGLVAGESLGGSLSRERSELAGTYEIQQGTVNNAFNRDYDIQFIAASLVISPIPAVTPPVDAGPRFGPSAATTSFTGTGVGPLVQFQLSSASELTSSQNISGAEGGTPTRTTAIPMLTLGVDGLSITGTMDVIEQGQSLKVAPSSAEVTSIPTFNGGEMRTVTVDYTLPEGSKHKVSVSVSLEGVLVIGVPQAVRGALDEQHILLLGISLAKERFGIQVDEIKGILIEDR